MDNIKLGLDEKSVLEKLEMARIIAPELEADSDASVQAVGAALAAENTTLRVKDTDRSQKEADAIEATGVLNDEEKVWDSVMKAAAAKVMEVYPNNPNKWKGYGFILAKHKNISTGKPDKVINLAATTGDSIKTVDLHWDNLYNAKYKIQICEGDPTIESNWKYAEPDYSTKSSITIINLEQGKLMWFRVAGVNASGQGIWSNPVSKTVP